MIKGNQKGLNCLHVLPDIMITTAVYALAWFIVISGKVIPLGVNAGVLKPQVYFMALIFIILICLILYASFRPYMPKRMQGRRSEFANTCKANIIGLMIFTFVLFGARKFIQHNEFFSTRMLLAFSVINVILMETERICIRLFLYSLRTGGHNQKHVLLIGYNRAAKGFIDRVNMNPEWGYHVQGIPDDNRRPGYRYGSVRILGPMDHLGTFLTPNTLDEIAITLNIEEYANLEPIVAACEKSGVHTRFIPGYSNITPTIPHMEDLQGLPIIHIRHVPPTDALSTTMRRIVDIVDALFGLIVFSPVIVLTAVLIKITSPGPMIFSRERIGLRNHPFRMYKFHSMEVQNPGKEWRQWTTPHDLRVTSMGRFIRKTSIGEIPQFFNVLVRNMSLVGPGPERSLFIEKLEEETPHYMTEYQVRPGLTGWAQVNGCRRDTSITKRIEHSLYYIGNWSLGLDFKIMFLTVFKRFINKNAY